MTFTAAERPDVVNYVANILSAERGINIQASALEVSDLLVENIRWTHVFYDSGLAINVLYTLDGDKPKRAVGLKLSDGMAEPTELSAFKYARQKSKLAGVIRGSFFVIKGEYEPLPL